jgi:hypothetical protein
MDDILYYFREFCSKKCGLRLGGFRSLEEVLVAGREGYQSALVKTTRDDKMI